jgi:hypothetical protein
MHAGAIGKMEKELLRIEQGYLSEKIMSQREEKQDWAV